MTSPASGWELLEQAIRYAHASADPVTPARLPFPTPCSAWDLGMLLSHLSDSLDALTEGLACGVVHLGPVAGAELDAEPAGMRARCGRLLAAISRTQGGTLVTVHDRDLPVSALAYAGAIEVAVHGWDISAACGTPRPIPADLAATLMDAALILIPASLRHGLFAAPFPLPPNSGPADRLLAFLGRTGAPGMSAS